MSRSVRYRTSRSESALTRRAAVAAGAAFALAAGMVAASSPSAVAADDGQVSASPVTQVRDGDAASVVVRLTRSSRLPVTVRWSTAPGTAAAGADFVAASGSVTFPAGTRAGTTRSISVPTKGSATARTARTFGVRLVPDGARLAGEQPVVVINAHGLPYLNPKLPVAARVKDLLARMTLAEKIGQMTQAERATSTRPVAHRDQRPRLAALRRRLDADAEHAAARGRT